MTMMVKLKMKTVYKTILIVVGFLILFAFLLGLIYMFYDKTKDDGSDVLVLGNLSVNYVDGQDILVNKNENITFSITNSSDKVTYYNIRFLQVRGTGTYKLTNDETVVTEGELSSTDEISTSSVSIDAKETIVYTLEINNSLEEPLTGVINIKEETNKKKTFADTILENNKVVENPLTKVGSEKSTTNEGLIKSYDDIGVTYYFRGSTRNNYVSFADHLWRIVRINGDGTVRLVLDNVTDSVTSYISEEQDDFSYKNSSLESYLKEWFDLNLVKYTDYIANGKYCNDISTNDFVTLNSYNRIMTNKIPTYNCLGDTFTSIIGTLNIDEVILAGANPDESNQDYYLYNSDITSEWYTLSGAKKSDSSINMFMVTETGKINTETDGSLYRNVRPVINLIKNIEVVGTGTISDPYTLVSE